MKRLTERQREVWDFIKKFTKSNNRPPTKKDLVGICGNATSYYLRILDHKGYIKRPGKGYTGMIVTGQEHRCHRKPLVPEWHAKNVRKEEKKGSTKQDEQEVTSQNVTITVPPRLMWALITVVIALILTVVAITVVGII